MRHTLILCISSAIFVLLASHTTAASITYQDSDPGSASWFPAAAPVVGDLAESATVTLVQGSTHGLSGPFTNLTDGLGGTGELPTSWFSNLGPGSNPDKIQIDLGSNKMIGKVNTFSWQDFDNNDRRFPQIFQLYGSTALAPATDDVTLASATWDLLATVDSTTVFPYDGYNVNFPGPVDYDPAPEQLAVTITGNGGSHLGIYRYLLFRITVAPDPDGPGTNRLAGISPFWSEIDVIEAPEPCSLVLLTMGALGLILYRRRKSCR